MLHSAQPLYKSFYYFIYSAIMIHAAGYSVFIYLHNYSLKKKKSRVIITFIFISCNQVGSYSLP